MLQQAWESSDGEELGITRGETSVLALEPEVYGRELYTM